MSSLFIDLGPPADNKKKVAICTTVYGSPAPGYTFSIQRSRQALQAACINSAYILLAGDCHVDDARNSVVHEFMQSDCTDLVFIDADVVWDPCMLVKLCKHDLDIVGGVYPYKRDGPKNMETMPVYTIPGVVEPDGTGLLQVAGMPTGFLKIRRNVFESLYPKAQQHWKRGDRRGKIAILFERTYDAGGRVGGDISFCRKWIAEGGKVFADVNLHLGHHGDTVLYDSLGAALRRQGGETLKYLADHVRAGGVDVNVFIEAKKAVGNAWGAIEDTLLLCAIMGRKADGPIIESGSGLTTVVLAAASKHPVIALEHSPMWKDQTERLARAAGVEVDVRLCDLKDGFYDVPMLDCALGVNDGPPRMLGDRMKFFDKFRPPVVICDDADDRIYGDQLETWANDHNYTIDFIERSALLRRK